MLDGSTKVSANQIRLEQVFSIERILKSRGFNIAEQGEATSTILPKQNWTYSEANAIFEAFDRPEIRACLMQLCKLSPDETLKRASSIVGGLPILINRQRFSHTYEWYIGVLIVRRFGAFSSSFGVIVRDIKRNHDRGNLGDYDVLTVMGDTSILYIECKTGKCDLHAIKQTIERASALHVVASVILLDQGVSKKDLSQQIRAGSHPMLNIGNPLLHKISINGVPNSLVYRWHDCFFLTGGEPRQIEQGLQTILRLIAYDRIQFQESRAYNPVKLNLRGYVCEEI